MGLLSGITNFTKNLASDVAGGLNLLSAAFIKPRETAAALISREPEKIVKVVKETKKTPLKEAVINTIKTTAAASAVIITAPIVAKVVGTKAIAATAIPVVTLGLAAPKTTSKIIETPVLLETAAATALGGGVVGAVVGIEKGTSVLTEAVKEHIPQLAEAAKTAGIIAGGAAVAGVTAAGAAALLKPDKDKEGELIKEKAIKTDEGEAITPETTTINTSKRRRKRAIIKEKPSVRQNVRVGVIVQNKATGKSVYLRHNRVTERYLNQRMLN